jgi:hypothetical protein
MIPFIINWIRLIGWNTFSFDQRFGTLEKLFGANVPVPKRTQMILVVYPAKPHSDGRIELGQR